MCTHLAADHYSNFLPRSNSRVSIKAVVINVHTPETTLHWPSRYTPIFLSLTAIKINSVWQDCQGKLLLNRAPLSLAYGTQIEADCSIRQLSFHGDKKLFSYPLYLKTRGFTHKAYLNKITSQTQATSWRAALEKLFFARDSLILRITAGISDDADKRLLASLVFGYRSLLDQREKIEFRQSGTIHLFAVSGLHVGMAAGIILILLNLCSVNFRRRHLCLPILLLIYVLMTGSPPSAVRAYVMISVWATGRGLMLPSNGLTNIAISAFLLLFLDPLNIIAPGFLYTFIITSCLVIGYRLGLDLFQAISEKQKWRGGFPMNSPLAFKAFSLICCSFLASSSAVGLNILFNEIVIPFAFITNFFAAMLAWCCFANALFCLSGLSLFYTIQETLLELMRSVVHLGNFSFQSAQSHVIFIILFYILVFRLLLNKKKRLCVAAALIILLLFITRPANSTLTHISLSASSNIPSLLIKHEKNMTLVNCASPALLPFCRSKNVDYLILTDNTVSHRIFLQSYLEQCRIKNIICLEKPSSRLHKLLKKVNFRGKVLFDTKLVHMHTTKSEDSRAYDFRLDMSSPQSQFSCYIHRDKLAFTQLKLSFHQDKKKVQTREFELTYSNIGFYKKVDF